MMFSWLSSLYILWAGLLLGVSFISTPAKFMAPNLTMPVALEVGKATFHLFNKVEWGIMGLTLLAAYFDGSGILHWWLAGVLAVLMALETFWLLPVVDIRADLVIAGESVYSGKPHLFYIIADILKITTLLAGSWLVSSRAVQ